MATWWQRLLNFTQTTRFPVCQRTPNTAC
ncbi:hypothetical protein ACFX11_006046 [Malus domestica]